LAARYCSDKEIVNGGCDRLHYLNHYFQEFLPLLQQVNEHRSSVSCLWHGRLKVARPADLIAANSYLSTVE
jgi:hypothetical protein